MVVSHFAGNSGVDSASTLSLSSLPAELSCSSCDSLFPVSDLQHCAQCYVNVCERCWSVAHDTSHIQTSPQWLVDDLSGKELARASAEQLCVWLLRRNVTPLSSERNELLVQVTKVMEQCRDYQQQCYAAILGPTF